MSQTEESTEPREIEFHGVNFTLSLEDRMKGAAGVPAWSRRLRLLEDTEEKLWKAAEVLHQELLALNLSREEFEVRWRRELTELPFERLEQMVHDYNEYFPTEANLPMDPTLGTFTHAGKAWTKKVPVTLQDVMKHYERK